MDIKRLFVFFPLVVPIWEKVPFDVKNTYPPEEQFYADDASIRLQYDYFTRTQDSRLRSKIAMSLAYSGNKSAMDYLERSLEHEKNTLVQADILNSLYNLRGYGNCRKVSCLKELIKSPERSVRGLSAVLYVRATNDLLPLYELLAGESSEYVMNFVWGQIASDRELARHFRDSELERFLVSENSLQRAGAVRVAAIKSEDPDRELRLGRFLQDKDIYVRSVLASSLGARESGGLSLLSKLSVEKDASIRGCVASSFPAADRLEVLVRLSGDSDEEVRRLSCVSLGGYGEQAAIDALILRIGDESLQVRTAAERSLIRIRPGKEVLKRIGDESLADRKSRASAVVILGELDDRRYSPAIEKLLKEVGDEESDLVWRCVRALGRLDYKDSWGAVAARAGHKEYCVREAVAWALGKFKVKESYDVIVKLGGDSVVDVSAQAFEAMGWIADGYFSKALFGAIKKTVAEYPSDNRSHACWSIARIGEPSRELFNQLDALCTKKILITPMGGPIYDADSVRLSALFTLIELGKKDPLYKEKAVEVIKWYLGPSDPFSGTASPALKDYARQAKAYMDGEKVSPGEVMTRKPVFIIEEFKPKNEQ